MPVFVHAHNDRGKFEKTNLSDRVYHDSLMFVEIIFYTYFHLHYVQKYKVKRAASMTGINLT